MSDKGRKVRWAVLGAVLALVVVAAVLLVLRVPSSADVLRRRMIQTISERLEAEVEIGDLKLQLMPRVRVQGSRLTIRHKGRRDVPPLISIEAFTVDATLGGLWRKHVDKVDLVGLDIQIPPGDSASAPADAEPRNGNPIADGTPSKPRESSGGGAGSGPAKTSAAAGVIVDELVADNAKLTIIPRERDKNPKVWVMHELHLNDVGTSQRMPFRSLLTNAVPPGEINTSGSFGPWNVDDPGRTPLEGRFTFDKANLGVFSGISGILSAHGAYGGSLHRIEVQGETETPEFMVNISKHTVPLKASYRAVIDGTNGDTALDEINASFLSTALVAKGGVFDVKGADGRLVTLDITIDKGRLEDIMRLAIDAPRAPMTGELRLNTRFDLPPGKQDVVEKLKLNGQFAIKRGRFTDPGVQQRINELSHRASGKPITDDKAPQRVSSDFSGRFQQGNGSLALQSLTFDVPGAVVSVDGRYGLRRETLAFSGKLIMEAKLSQTTGGFKSLLLKIVDPLFRRNGRTVVPIRINGTRDHPSFGLDVGRVLKR